MEGTKTLERHDPIEGIFDCDKSPLCTQMPTGHIEYTNRINVPKFSSSFKATIVRRILPPTLDAGQGPKMTPY